MRKRILDRWEKACPGHTDRNPYAVVERMLRTFPREFTIVLDPDGRFLDWCTQKGNSRKWERNEGKFECLYLETVKLWAADIHAAPEGDPNNSLAPSQQKLFDWLGEGAQSPEAMDKALRGGVAAAWESMLHQGDVPEKLRIEEGER